MADLLTALKQYINDASPGGALNPEISKGMPTDVAKGLLGITPVVGDGISLYDTINSLRDGEYGDAALNGVGLIPFIPGMAIDPKMKPKWIEQLRTGKAEDSLRIGDITDGQGRRAGGLLGGRKPETNDVTIPAQRSSKVRNGRVIDEGFEPEFIGGVTENGLKKNSSVEIDPASTNKHPSLIQRGLKDDVTGKMYDARVPIKISADGKSWELVGVVPDGLPPRKTKPSTR